MSDGRARMIRISNALHCYRMSELELHNKREREYKLGKPALCDWFIRDENGIIYGGKVDENGKVTASALAGIAGLDKTPAEFFRALESGEEVLVL